MKVRPLVRLRKFGIFGALAAIYLIFVFPLKGLISEYQQVQSARKSLAELTRTHQSLQRQVSQYENPAYVARVARTSYGLVERGQTSYMIMPGSPLYVPPVPRTKESPS